VRTVSVTTVFGNVSGLKEGNNVWFSGVKVGTIKRIEFFGESQVRVTLKIEENARQYIRKDAKARLSSESLIGNRIVEIYSGTPEKPPIEDGDRLVTEGAVSTDDMMKTLQENNQNLLRITSDFKQISSGIAQGRGTAGALLTDSVMANRFREIAANLEQVSATTVRTANALSQFTTRLNNSDGLANQLLTDTVVFAQLKSSVNQLQQTATSASEISDNLKAATDRLNRDDNAVGMMLRDKQFADQLKNTVQGLQSNSRKLDENLDALRYSFLLRRAFKRKDKADAKRADTLR
jgi:phospholipid/cholesterol/gamma-HCH transport system substrate-binding protein